MATKIRNYISKEDQLPKDKIQIEMLEFIWSYYIKEDKGYSFEKFAIEMTKRMNSSVIDIERTRPFKDGGFDGEGYYKIFDSIEKSITVEFYIEAKCYNSNNSIGVKETSRLISRIKNRRFGVLFTTSYIAKQAYDEIIEDSHPIVLITGNDITKHLYDVEEIHNIKDLQTWIFKNIR